MQHETAERAPGTIKSSKTSTCCSGAAGVNKLAAWVKISGFGLDFDTSQTLQESASLSKSVMFHFLCLPVIRLNAGHQQTPWHLIARDDVVHQRKELFVQGSLQIKVATMG